jgi:hypothetical protein
MRAGQSHQAAQLLAYVASHPAGEYTVKNNARRLLAGIQDQEEPPTATTPDEQQIEKLLQIITGAPLD